MPPAKSTVRDVSTEDAVALRTAIPMKSLTNAPIAVINCDCIACFFVNPLRIRME
ncbi:hypothetical protein HHX47_DHR7000411 [Lentinula edodes]|nr:hypothetical protein HHX47_DHR7000411 [Lentinula edodes]